MPYQFLAHKNKFFDPCQRGRRIWTAPTGMDWTALLYFNLPDPEMPFVGYDGIPYPGGYPPYTRAQWISSQATLYPLPALPMYKDEYNALLEEAQKYLGHPYLWGGKSPPMFDCSGFVGYCFKKAGLLDKNVVAWTGTLWQATTKVDSPYFGDMVFWNGKNHTPADTNAHVEFFIGWKNEDAGEFWSLGSSSGGVQYRTYKTSAKSFNGFYRVPTERPSS